MSRIRISALFPVLTALLLAAPALSWAQGMAVPIDEKLILDRPAQITVYEGIPQPGADTLGVAIVNFEGQNLRAQGLHLGKSTTFRGTVRDLHATLNEPWKCDHFEVRDDGGKVIGYVMTHQNLVKGLTVYNPDLLLVEAFEDRD